MHTRNINFLFAYFVFLSASKRRGNKLIEAIGETIKLYFAVFGVPPLSELLKRCKKHPFLPKTSLEEDALPPFLMKLGKGSLPLHTNCIYDYTTPIDDVYDCTGDETTVAFWWLLSPNPSHRSLHHALPLNHQLESRSSG